MVLMRKTPSSGVTAAPTVSQELAVSVNVFHVELDNGEFEK